VTTCPQKFIGGITSVLPLVELFHAGLPPVAGGVLDQSAWFVEVARTVKREDAKVVQYLLDR